MAFKLVNIWNPKGGQGKSMITINLAAAAVEMGLKPLVICQDPQGTSIMMKEWEFPPPLPLNPRTLFLSIRQAKEFIDRIE